MALTDLEAIVKQARVAHFVLRQYVQQQQRFMRRAYVTLTPDRDLRDGRLQHFWRDHKNKSANRLILLRSCSEKR